jgi:hypothetical protein
MPTLEEARAVLKELAAPVAMNELPDELPENEISANQIQTDRISLGAGMSVALGDLWELAEDESHMETAQELLSMFAIAKLGLARAAHLSDWRERWRAVAERVMKHSPDPPSRDGAQTPAPEPHSGAGTHPFSSGFSWAASIRPQIVPVIYADWSLAAAPPPLEIVELAWEVGAQLVLIDTFTKDGRRLFDFLSIGQLRDIRCRLDRCGCRLVLAGSLTQADLPSLLRVNPAMVAVRGAVCAGNTRDRLDAGLLNQWLAAFAPYQ